MCSFRNWLIVTLIIAGVAAYLGWQSWPMLPLDSGGDAETQRIYQTAVTAHVLKYALIGIGIPLLLLIIGRVACGRRPERL